MDRESLRSHLIEACSLMAIEIRTDQVEQLLRFAAMVEAGNQRMNLTRIESEKEFAVKHLVDCLAVQKTDFGFSGRGIDVGSGAGFPGVVIASCLTTDPVVLVDSLEKRVGFCEKSVKRCSSVMWNVFTAGPRILPGTQVIVNGFNGRQPERWRLCRRF